MLLVYLASAWIAGLAFSNQINLPRDLLLWWLVFPVLSFFFARQNPRLRLLFLTLTFFLLGAIRFTLARPSADPNALAAWNDRGAMTLTGEVIDDPDVRDQHVNLRVHITRVRVQSATHTVSGLALVQAPREVQVRYGDQLEFFGEPITPPEFADFSYKEYLARQDIHSIVRVYSAPKIIAREQGNPFFAALYAFRHRALDTVYAIFPEPAASLLAGILLGVDSGIPSDLRDAFSATNTAHIIAISGFNVSIIAGILTQLARRVWSAGRAAIIVLVGLAVYTLLVGASASVLRAAIMGALVVIAAYLNRSSTAYIALAVAAFVMTALNPFTLFDLGFQLSFLATLGLILYTEPLEKLFARVIARSRFASLTVNSATKQSPNSNLEIASSSRSARLLAMTKDTFISTLAAQITTTPLIIFAFHRLSIIGLVTNFLVLPAQPAVMIWGGLATLVGMIAPPVGQLIGWIAWTFTEWTIVIVQFTARLPFAAIPIGYFDAVFVGAYYFILFGATRVDWKTLREKISLRPALMLASAFIILILVFNLALTAPDGKTHIEFFDAGGAATLIRAPNGAKILIDGGANPSATLSALGSRLPFWDRTIDLIVLTNPDDDHLAGLVAVVERYAVKQIIEPRAPARPGATYLKWREVIAQKSIPILAAQNNLQVELDRGVSFEIVAVGDAPSAPLIARLRAGTLGVLFADSAEIKDQDALTKSDASFASYALVAPRKLAPQFLDAVNPALAILFVGANARDKPAAELLNALSGVTTLRTDERGVIELIVEGERVQVRTTR